MFRAASDQFSPKCPVENHFGDSSLVMNPEPFRVVYSPVELEEALDHPKWVVYGPLDDA